MIFLGLFMIAVNFGLISPLMVLRNRSYAGDTLTHLMLPGALLGLILHSYIPWGEAWWFSVFGGVICGILGNYMIEAFIRLFHIPADTSTVLCLGILLALSLMGIFYFHEYESFYGNFESLLMGDWQNMTVSHVIFIVLITVFNLFVILFYRDHFDAWILDADFAKIMGFKTGLLEKIFPLMITFSIVSSLMTVGGLVVSCLIIMPAIIAKPWSILHINCILWSLFIMVSGVALYSITSIPLGSVLVLFGFFVLLTKTLWKIYLKQKRRNS